MWNGISDFINGYNATGIHSLDNLPELPEKVTLVEIPYLDYRSEELAKLKQFVESGGTLIIMDDYGRGNEILSYFGVDIRYSNNVLLDPLFNYRNQTMPRITDFDSEIKDSGINVITLNHATTLINADTSEVIAWSSAASFIDMDENGDWDENEPKGPFAVAARLQFGGGIICTLADPSIITSGMLDRDDDYAFIKYLTNSNSEQAEVIFDYSHLTETPLDISKTRLLDTRKVLSNPYALIGVTAVVFAVVFNFTLRKGKEVGKNEQSH
jgi:hypothetical protein